MEHPEVGVFASQLGRPLALKASVLTATAQPVNLEPIEEKGEAERETEVPLGDELEGVSFQQVAFIDTNVFCSTVLLIDFDFILPVTERHVLTLS